MKFIKELETIELKTPADHAKKIERLKFWCSEYRETDFAVKTIKESSYIHIFLVERRKTRSDAGKERVNRTGFRRGMNPLPRNLDKIFPFKKKD